MAEETFAEFVGFLRVPGWNQGEGVTGEPKDSYRGLGNFR